jgi:quercetin dioxygenase-like cupin family protein
MMGYQIGGSIFMGVFGAIVFIGIGFGIYVLINRNTEQALAVYITLEAGGTLKRHITPVDVCLYILEGEPTIEIGEETQKVTADHLVESPANIAYAISNETDRRVRILSWSNRQNRQPQQTWCRNSCFFKFFQRGHNAEPTPGVNT